MLLLDLNLHWIVSRYKETVVRNQFSLHQLNFIVRQRTEDILDHDDEKYSQFSEM